MAGYKNGFIKLDSPRDVYYAGQVVQGSVVVELDQPLTLSALYVNFLGEAKVDWKEKEREEYNGVVRIKDVDYVGREEYFNDTQVLVGANAPVSLPPGSHTYQFSYQIPPGVPSSFTGDRGGVNYCIKANLELSVKAANVDSQTIMKEELKKFFEVVAQFDLNLGSPALKESIDLEFEEVYNCGCFFGSDPITIRVRLPVSGYCPGQVIPVALNVNNESSVEVRKMIFQILTRERYRTQRPVSEYVPPERVLTTVTKGPVMSATKKNLTVELQVPELIAPNLENCGIIDVGYFFRIIIKLSGCKEDLEDEAEICLGLLPLKETLKGEYVHPLSHSLPIGPIPDIPIPSPEENRQHESQQQSAYTNNQGPPPEFPNNQSDDSDSQTKSSYFVQVREFNYSSTDPSQNYNIGFTMTSPGGQAQSMFNATSAQTWEMPDLGIFNKSDLKIHLPTPMVNVNIPSAPPPST